MHVPEPSQDRLQHSKGPVHAAPPGRQASQVPEPPQCIVQQVWSGWQRSVPEHANGGSQRVATQDPLKSGAGIRMENGLQQPTIWVLGPP